MAKTLALLVLGGIAFILLARRFLAGKDPTPGELADYVERLLEGRSGGWDIDDYEHMNPRDPQLRDLWNRSMVVGGLPEDWVRLDETKKNALREVITTLRDLDNALGSGHRTTR